MSEENGCEHDLREGLKTRVARHEALRKTELTGDSARLPDLERSADLEPAGGAGVVDAGLVELARGGSADAWELLYRGIYPRLWAYMARRVGPENADDAVSETMVRAVVGLGGMTLGPAGFDGWTFGIARRVAADHHRGTERRRRREQAAPGFSSAQEVFDSAVDGLVAADDRAELRRAFDKLSPADRELLELRVVAGLSADAAAEVLGRRPGAVRTAQSRALRRLRVLLEGDDG